MRELEPGCLAVFVDVRRCEQLAATVPGPLNPRTTELLGKVVTVRSFDGNDYCACCVEVCAEWLEAWCKSFGHGAVRQYHTHTANLRRIDGYEPERAVERERVAMDALHGREEGEG